MILSKKTSGKVTNARLGSSYIRLYDVMDRPFNQERLKVSEPNACTIANLIYRASEIDEQRAVKCRLPLKNSLKRHTAEGLHYIKVVISNKKRTYDYGLILQDFSFNTVFAVYSNDYAKAKKIFNFVKLTFFKTLKAEEKSYDIYSKLPETIKIHKEQEKQLNDILAKAFNNVVDNLI